MSLGAIPAYLSITEFAYAVSLPRHSIEYMVERGQLPSTQLATRGKRRIPMAAIQADHPHLWDALVARWDTLQERLDELSTRGPR